MIKQELQQVCARRASDQVQAGQLDQPDGEPWSTDCLWSGPALGSGGQALIPHCVQLLTWGHLGGMGQSPSWEPLRAVGVNVGFSVEGELSGLPPGLL